MNKRFGYILGGMGALAACVLLILAGARVWLRTDTAQRLVQEKISNAIPGTVEWKELDFSVFAGKAELHGLLLKGPDGDTLIAADRVLANVALTDLFRRKITIETAELDHPQIFLETDPQGQLNLMRAFPASDKAEKTSQGSPPDILIREAKITDGFFRFAKTGEKPEHVTLEHIDLTAADGDVFRPEGRATLRIGSGDVDMAGIRTRLEKFETNAALKSAQLSPLNLTLETGFGLLTLSGTVDDILTAPRLDLKLALDTALENIRNALSLPAELSGAAKLNLSVTGAVNDPDALLTLNYGGGNLAGNPVDRLDLDCALKQRLLTFNRLDVDAPAGSATLTGTVSLEKYFPGGFLSPPADLNAIAYDLALNLKQLALDKPPLEKAGMGGTASGTLTLSGTGVLPEQLAANAKLDLNAEKFALGKAIAPSDIELSADVKLVENRASVSALDLKTRKSELQVSGEYDLASRNADAKLKLDAPDLALLLAAFGVKGLTGKAVLDADISGPAVQPDISARLSGDGLKFDAVTIGNLKLDALLNQAGTVKISSLDLKNQGSALQAKGTLRLFEKGWKFISDMPADLDLAFQNVEADDFVKNNDFKGTITGTLAAKGPLLRPDAVLNLDGKKLAFQSTRIGDVETALRLAAGTLAVDRLKLRNARSGLNLSGTARVLDAKTGKPLENPGFDLKLSDTVIFPADFTDALAGKILLNAGLHGTLKAPAADISLSAEKLEAGKNRIGDLDAALRFADGNLDIRQMKLRNRTSGLNLSGTVALLDPDTLKPLADPRLNLKLADTALHLRDFGDDFRGDLNLSADITGTAKNPKAALSVDGKKLEFSGNRVGDVNAAVRFADGTLFLEPVEVTNRKSGLKITGTAKVLDSATLKPLEDPAFDLAVSGDALYLNDFVKDMKGKLSLNAKMGGTLNHPAGRLSLDGKRLDFGVQKIAGIHLDSRLDGERVNIESFLVAMGKGEEIATDGWIWPRKKQYDLRMKTGGISLHRINALEDSAVGDGKISFSIAGNGTFENPRLEGDITVGGLKINRKTIEDLRLKVDVQDYIARISGNADFNLDAQYHLKTRDFSATARFDNTDLTPWLMIAGMEAASGVVTGTLTASGNADNADGIKAAADFSRLELSTGKTGLVRTENFTASFEKGRIHLPKLRLALLDKGYLDISGTGEMAGAMDFRADGLIPLEVIRPFATDLNDITGTLKLSASAGGTFKKPEIRADIDLEKIGLTVPGLLQKLHGLNGKIRLTPSEIVLNAVRGNLDTGTFALSGTAALKDFQPDKISAKLAADALPVKVPDMLDLLLSTNLSLDGTLRKSALKGEVTLLDGRYYKDVTINLLEGIGQKKREESPVTAGKPDPFLDHMALDITVKHRNPFTVDNNMALLTIKPDLRVYGTASVPLVSGRAEVDSGTITYQNKEFEVKKGVVDFLNPYKIEPTLDIESDVTIRSWVVTLTVSGTPDALKLKLSSSPHEEDGDILSLLTIGKTTRELIAGEGGTSRSPKQMLADIAATQLKGRLRDATGLDIVELEYNEKSGDETADEVRVTVGKELSRRMSVKYGVESKNGETVQKAVAEYRFLENLLMRTFQDTGGNFGGELVYRLEFR